MENAIESTVKFIKGHGRKNTTLMCDTRKVIRADLIFK